MMGTRSQGIPHPCSGKGKGEGRIYPGAEGCFAAYEKYQTQNREDRYARRRRGRLDAKRDRHGCEECGTAIAIHTIATARFCSDMCQRRNYNRRRAIQLRDERLAKRAKRGRTEVEGAVDTKPRKCVNGISGLGPSL
jgi:hypothetical protein